MKNFGEKVRLLREEKGISREEFCGDESELSVRQLARIELQQSIPNLSKALFIADILKIGLGILTDGKSLELPKRYKELKYLILRTPTYQNKERVQIRDNYFEEIYLNFHDDVSEEERLIIECMQSKADVFVTQDINFGISLLDEYFEQIKVKKRYSFNDFIIIDLYLTCLMASKCDTPLFDKETFSHLTTTLLQQEDSLSLEEIFILSNILFTSISLLSTLRMWENVENTVQVLKDIMSKIQDYQKKPILSMVEWKYAIGRFNDFEKAHALYQESLLFAKLIGDSYLADKLSEEWKKDAT